MRIHGHIQVGRYFHGAHGAVRDDLAIPRTGRGIPKTVFKQQSPMYTGAIRPSFILHSTSISAALSSPLTPTLHATKPLYDHNTIHSPA